MIFLWTVYTYFDLKAIINLLVEGRQIKLSIGKKREIENETHTHMEYTDLDETPLSGVYDM